MAKARRPIKDRLLDLIDKDRDCWVWTGSTNSQGYGRLTTGSRSDNTRKTEAAHRASYRTFVGEIPNGLTIDHLCRNRKCINPDHLEAVTIKENVSRGNPLWKQQMARTHCPQGHEYTEDNIYRYATKHGGTCRNCKTCMKARSIQRSIDKRLGVCCG